MLLSSFIKTYQVVIITCFRTNASILEKYISSLQSTNQIILYFGKWPFVVSSANLQAQEPFQLADRKIGQSRNALSSLKFPNANL